MSEEQRQEGTVRASKLRSETRAGGRLMGAPLAMVVENNELEHQYNFRCSSDPADIIQYITLLSYREISAKI